MKCILLSLECNLLRNVFNGSAVKDILSCTKAKVATFVSGLFGSVKQALSKEISKTETGQRAIRLYVINKLLRTDLLQHQDFENFLLNQLDQELKYPVSNHLYSKISTILEQPSEIRLQRKVINLQEYADTYFESLVLEFQKEQIQIRQNESDVLIQEVQLIDQKLSSQEALIDEFQTRNSHSFNITFSCFYQKLNISSSHQLIQKELNTHDELRKMLQDYQKFPGLDFQRPFNFSSEEILQKISPIEELSAFALGVNNQTYDNLSFRFFRYLG